MNRNLDDLLDAAFVLTFSLLAPAMFASLVSSLF